MKHLSALKRSLYLAVARYFRWWANFSLRRWQPRIIAVTGSVGKTTMLHLIEQQLGRAAHYSHHANSAYGIAFDIVGLRGITGSSWRWLWLLIAVPYRALSYTRHGEYYVVEIDGERPHEVEFVASWLRPEVTLWVSLGNSHAVYFDDQVATGQFDSVEQAIAHEFACLPHHTATLVIADGDEPLIRSSLEKVRVRTEYASLDELKHYDVEPSKSQFGFDGGTFSFNYPLPRETAMQLSMLTRLMKYLEYDINYDLTDFVMPPGRSSFFRGIESTQLIDSSYNAHLISMYSMIDMFDAMRADHKWLVLGDMIEQGASEADQHEQLGQRLLDCNAERILLVGRRLHEHTAPILATSSAQVTVFDSPSGALDYITTELSGGETILFKGSQYLEWLVEKLLLDPTDRHMLARQEPAAQKRRRARGLA